jgi:hypothetical protein
MAVKGKTVPVHVMKAYSDGRRGGGILHSFITLSLYGSK